MSNNLRGLLSGQTISRVIALGFFALLAWYGYNNQELFDGFSEVSIFTILGVSALMFVGTVISGLFTKVTSEVFVDRIPLRETVYIAIISAVGNYIGPIVGGASIRAVHLKKLYKLPYAKFASTIAGYYLIVFLANSAIALVSLYYLERSDQSAGLFLFFGAWFVAFLWMMVIRLPRRSRFDWVKPKVGRFVIDVLYDIETGWRRIASNGALLVKLLGLAASAFITNFVIAYVEFTAIGVSPSLASIGLYTSVVMVATLLNLTPGALGVREALLVVVAASLGVSVEEILQVSILDRAIGFVFLAVSYAVVKIPAVRKKMSPKGSVF